MTPVVTAEIPPRRPASLRRTVRGPVHLPDDQGYAAARHAWNLNAVQHPAAVVQPLDTEDVRAAVRWAAAAGLGVGVQATGHGSARPADGGLLLNTSRMRRLDVDPDRRRAQISAGVIWRDLVRATASYGLTGLPGSSTTVGVVGYTLGGGFGWLGRRLGLSALSVVGVEIVTADGERRWISGHHGEDLFWAVPGGLGALGVVTRLDLRLHPLPVVYAGNLFYPHHRLSDLLGFFSEWSRTTPDELTAAVTVRRFPPAPTVPEPLRGQVLVALRGAHAGDVHQGAELIGSARTALGPALVDTFAPLPIERLVEVSADPVDPLAARQHHELLSDLTSEAIDDLVALAGSDSGWPLVMTEVRQLGGALSGPPDALSPMAHTRARFSLNAVGMTASADQDAAVRAHLRDVAARMARHATGDSYLNFLDLDQATPERVRAAFSPADRRRLSALKHHYDPADVFRFGRRLQES